MATERYHEAAKDGIIEILKECSRKDCNSKDDENEMTPVLWACWAGHVEAVRLLIGKGGDPDRADQFGNTALHLAAARGHMSCVDFLVKFGCNLYALDIDNHTPKDLAGINNRDDILRYLDAVTAQLEISDKKKAGRMKETAKKQAEKRRKEYMKKQQLRPADPASKLQLQSKSSNKLQTWRQKLWSGSQGNLKHALYAECNYNTCNADASKKYSTLVSGGGTVTTKSTVQRRVLKTKQQETDDFKIGEIEPNGKRSVRSIQGLRRDSEVLYVGTYDSTNDPSRRGKISDIFIDRNANSETGGDSSDTNSQSKGHNNLSRSVSQPDFFHTSTHDTDDEQEALENNLLNRHANGNLFNKPMLGTLTIPKSIVTIPHPQQSEHSSDRSSSNESGVQQSNKLRNGGNHLRPKGTRQFPFISSETDSEDDTSNMDDSADGLSSIERFLIAWGLGDYVHIFEQQQIDLDTLMLLTESDLKSLSLPLGPYRKLCIAIQERKNALQNPGIITDTRF